jgi:hypothetical protein
MCYSKKNAQPGLHQARDSETVTNSKMTECYLQAWAWAHLAGSARRASGPAAAGGGEPRALHLGSSPVSIPCTLGTTHQPNQD